MNGVAKLPKWLVLAVAIMLGACVSNDRADDPSTPARRTLADAMGTDSSDLLPLDTLRNAAQTAPNDAAVQERYGIAAERAALYPEALAAIDRAVAVGGATPSRLLAKGRIALETGDVPAAARAYRQILQDDSGDIDALNGLGVADDLEHHHEQARERYRTALRLAPKDWRVRSNLAMSLLMSGSPDEAANALTGAESDAAAPHRARQDLALALVAAGKRAQAISVLREDMPAPEAASLADEFAGFAKWLASPQGSIPATR